MKKNINNILFSNEKRILIKFKYLLLFIFLTKKVRYLDSSCGGGEELDRCCEIKLVSSIRR